MDAADIGVSVDAGVVTLRGDVGSYAARAAAERVTLRVYGVKSDHHAVLLRGDRLCPLLASVPDLKF